MIREFKNQVSNADSIVYDGDPLHPHAAYLKDAHLIGLEFTNRPSCGEHTKRYLIKDGKTIEKIIVRKNYLSGDCGVPFDSIFVIEPKTKQIEVYTKNTKAKKIINDNFVANELIDLDKYREKIKKWKRR